MADAAGADSPGGPNFEGFDFSEFLRQQQASQQRGPGAGHAPSGSEDDRAGGSFRDIFSEFFGRGGGAGRQPVQPERGADLEYGLNIDFWQSMKGTQVKSEYFTAGNLRRLSWQRRLR